MMRLTRTALDFLRRQQAPRARSIFLLAVFVMILGTSWSCKWFGPRCKFCGEWAMGNDAVHTHEGWRVCKRCNGEAVRDLATARALVAETRAELVSMGIKIPWGVIPVQLDGATLPGPEVNARCEAGRLGDGSVMLLRLKFRPGMPKAMFKGVTAHELTHAWAYVNRSPLKQDETLHEGGPTFVEYMYHEQHPSPVGEYKRHVIDTTSNKIYGGGARRLQKYAKDKGGLAGVLALLKSSKSIPAGY